MKFDFKSSGYKIDDKKFKLTPEQKIATKSIPFGIKTPVSFGNNQNQLFEMNYNPIDQIKDNLKNLLQTNNGERLCRHDFGCSLNTLLFERISANQSFESIAIDMITKQVERYIPIVQIDNIFFNVNQKKFNDITSLSKVDIRLNFSIPRIQLTNQAIEIIMYIGG